VLERARRPGTVARPTWTTTEEEPVPSDRNEAAVDVIVLGAGSTGTNVAWYARDHGLSVAIVEAELVGGECSYWACIPSKALLVPSELVAAARRLPPAAAAVTGQVEAEAVLAHRTEQTGGWDDDGQAAWLDDLGVTLLRGRGRLAAERTVEVTGDGSEPQRLRARRAVVVATGSRASIPPIDGLREAGVWDNRDVTAAERVPDHLLVLGGGAVGCEMAQAYRRLGAEVTLIEMAERLLGPYEPEAAALLQETLEAEDVTVLTGTTAAAVRRDRVDGPVTVTAEDGRELAGDELLVAIGRTPNTDDLGLEHVGLEPGGPLEVDDRLRVVGVDGDWLYAAGDVTGRALLTHQGKYQARIVGDVLGGRDIEAWADHGAVPQVVFTDPNVAAVGRTEAEAREDGLDVATAVADPSSTAGGSLHGLERGFGKLVIDRDRRVVVGATFVGAGVGELLHAATIAIVGAVPLHVLWHATPAFPTVSEVWLRLLEDERGL
jgi:pyruvate/2-oxoglutarate dehydrogenase complex dihydrolipoamide dehydrogenase (E3) component